MSQSFFIQVLSSSSTGAAGNLPRSFVIATRETIAGYTPDVNSGLIRVTPAMVDAFVVGNPTAIATNYALQVLNANNAKPQEVYVLPTGGGALTEAMLNKANYRPRSWSFIDIASAGRGIGDTVSYVNDMKVVSAWATRARKKIFVASFAAEETTGSITLPEELLIDGVLHQGARINTPITNAYKEIDEYTRVYHNPLLGVLAFCLYGGSIARSLGSLSDAHDFALVAPDTYSAAVRAYIESQSLSQYNDAKDQNGSNFWYDTFFNSTVFPPNTPQMESAIAEDYIDDFVTIYVRNSLIRAGETGIEASYAGLLKLYALTKSALKILWSNGVIQTLNGSPDFTVSLKSEAQIEALSPNWRQTGEIPVGAIVGNIRSFKALHYAPIAFTYQ